MPLATLYAQSKGVNAVYKSLELSVQAAKSFSDLLGRVGEEQALQAFYQNPGEGNMPKVPVEKMTPEAVRLAITLPHLLALRYSGGDRFRKIRFSGDAEGNFPEMGMEDFYVALSFLREEDLQSQDSYVRLEQQGLSRGERTRHFDLGQMATDYASEVLINAYPRAVVMGNPGVGKSTFANWICHEWAYARLSLDRVPLHVNLKEVMSFSGEVSLLEYLNEQYVSAPAATYGEVLKHLGDHFHFIFDGFDELSQENRRKFKRTLRQLNEGRGHLNYTLLGRPYAFFDQAFREAKKFRIRGFNEASIERYLEATVGRRNEPEKTVERLQKEVIANNPVLEEYAHSPLILSYVVLIYLKLPLPVALRKLKGIRSKYELYEEVFQWLADYNLRQRDPDAEPLEEADFAFARTVSLSKSFRYQSASIRTEDYQRATKFAAHGFGSLDRQATGERWRFSFSSVALQEYLTARHLAKSITPEQFIYLSRDTFFWNICQLIIGALTRSSEEGKLNEIFARLRSEQENKEEETTSIFLRNKFGFLTYSLLAESSERRIRKWAEAGGIIDLFRDLITHYFDDEWNQPLLEAATRMCQKLRPGGREHFRQSVRKLMENVRQTDYQDRMASRRLYVVLDLAFLSDAAADAPFAQSIFDLLNCLLDDYAAFDEEEETEDDLDSYGAISAQENNRQEVGEAIFLLLQLAARIPSALLLTHRNDLAGLYARCELGFREDVVYLQAKITPRDKARRALSAQLQKVTNTLPRYTEISTVRDIFEQEIDREQGRAFPESLTELVHAAFTFTRTEGDWEAGDVALVLNTVRAYSDRFLNPHYWEPEGERGVLSTTLLETLADVPGEPQVLDMMYTVFTQAQLLGTDCSVDFQDKAVYWSRLENLFRDLQLASSVPGTGLLAYLLHFVQPGHLAMARFRDNFVGVADRYLTDNASELSGEAMASPTEEALEQLLLAPVFEFDRNISLTLVMNYSDGLGQLRRQLMAELLERRSAIYEPRYLAFLRERLAAPGRETEVAEYLEWDGLYGHASNLPLLREALSYLISSFATNPESLSQYAVFLLMASSKFVMLLSRSEEWKITDALAELRGLLGAEEILEVLTDPQQLEILTAEDLLGYPLLYAATEDKVFAVDYDYPHFRREVPAEATKLLHLLCLYLVPSATREELDEVNIVGQGMPRGLYDDFVDYAERFYLRRERFLVGEFERLGR